MRGRAERGREGGRERASERHQQHTHAVLHTGTLAPRYCTSFCVDNRHRHRLVRSPVCVFASVPHLSVRCPLFPQTLHHKKKRLQLPTTAGGVGRPHHEGHPEHDMHMGHGSPGRVASAHAHTCAHERAVIASPAPGLCGTWGPREPAVSTAPSCDNVPRTMAACPRVRIRRQRDIDGS